MALVVVVDCRHRSSWAACTVCCAERVAHGEYSAVWGVRLCSTTMASIHKQFVVSSSCKGGNRCAKGWQHAMYAPMLYCGALVRLYLP